MEEPDVFALKNKVKSEEAEALAKKLLPQAYERILRILDTYMEMRKEDKELVSTWVIGTYLYKQFPSFPRLYVNAMKGSGKSRLMQILKTLCWKGTVQTNLTEAVLFRSANQNTLLFDECEGIGTKEKGALRELLNSGYKRGTSVKRMRKTFSKDGEQHVTENFDIYGPVALANISGMEDVLGDRCITIILEKSKNQSKTRLIEDFEENPIILDLKRTLDMILVYSVGVGMPIESVSKYNLYTLTTLSTYTTQTTQTTLENNIYNLKPLLPGASEWDLEITNDEKKFFDEMADIKIDGRNLELFFPLINISYAISQKVFDDFKLIAKKFVEEKNKEDQIENRDWSLIDFISKQPQTLNFIPVSDLLLNFRIFYAADDTEWLNSLWMGKALRRLNLVIDKRRLGKGIEYIINVSKAQEKIKLFKQDGDTEEIETD